MTTDDETLWTAADVAAYLKLSRSWVYHRAEANELPHFKIGGQLRFCPAEIRAYVRGTKPEVARVVPFTRRKAI
jgi:excisionase family DNA binding protein